MTLSQFNYKVHKVLNNDTNQTQFLYNFVGSLAQAKEETIGYLRLPLNTGYWMQSYRSSPPENQEFYLLTDTEGKVHAKFQPLN